MQPWVGKLLVVAGIVLLILGVLILLAPKIPWLGSLPGDFQIRGRRYSIYLPLGTSIVLSILLTILLNLFFRR